MPSAQRYLRVVEHLLAEDAPRHLLALQETAAYIAMEDSSIAVIIHPSKRGDELLHALQEQLASNKRVHHKLVVIGGEQDMQTLLAQCQPGVLSRRMVQVYQLSRTGEIWSGRGSRLDSAVGRALEAALEPREAEPDVEALKTRIRTPTRRETEAYAEQVDFVRGYKQVRPTFTIGAVAFLLGVFGLQLTWGGGEFVPTLVRMGANTEASLNGEPWRLLASVALHGGWMHIGANCLMLYILGGQLERILGWARLALLLVVAGALGSLFSALHAEALLSVGASGAIWGILGAAAGLAIKPRGLVPPPVADGLRRAAFANLALNIGISFLPGIDFMAHLGGGVAGFGLAFAGTLSGGLAPLGDRDENWTDGSWIRRLATGGSLAVLLSVGAAIGWGRPWELGGRPELHPVAVGESGYAVEVPRRTVTFETSVQGDDLLFSAGELMTDPFVVGVTIRDSDSAGPITAEEREAFFERPTQPDEGAKIGPRTTIEDGEHPAFEEVFTYENGARLFLRYTLFSDAEVVVSVFVWPEASEQVVSAARFAMASLQRGTADAE